MRSRISKKGYVRPSVRPSVRRSVCPSVGHTRVEFLIFRLKWNKIALGTWCYATWRTLRLKLNKRASIGKFKGKCAGRSPERILCLYSVRLVSFFSVFFSRVKRTENDFVVVQSLFFRRSSGRRNSCKDVLITNIGIIITVASQSSTHSLRLKTKDAISFTLNLRNVKIPFRTS